ncbi:hypothetical protein [Glycomyces buryatensis]|uniref:Uncharacterized protein n=1 Tax=Glycomyces buryatensis TaxID=2570927 RepID=A0A4S8Q8C8_9ACTN|nr:hypothetical protein [Glycomyces buryatensis]THV40528.1 hypothetical protein FAB82_14760 [Glycomyces buryatensis]
MTSIGDVAATLRGAMQVIDEAIKSAQAAESEMGQAESTLRGQLEGSSNELVGQGFSQLEQARAKLEEGLKAYHAGNKAMGDYVASIAGGGGGGGGLTSSVASSARIKAPALPDDPSGMIGQPVTPDFMNFSEVNRILGFDPAEPESARNNDLVPGISERIEIEEDRNQDESLGRPRQFGRNMVRGAEDLGNFAGTMEKGAKVPHDAWEPPPDPHSYNTGTAVPEPVRTVSTATSDTSGSIPDVMVTVVMTSAVLAEGISRMAHRRKDSK